MRFLLELTDCRRRGPLSRLTGICARETNMKLIGSTERVCYWVLAALLVSAAVLVSTGAAPAYGQRVFGLDTSSAANGDVTQTQWNNAYNVGGGGVSSFQFAFVRSNHGIPATGGTDD